jgi:hypothetical protein
MCRPKEAADYPVVVDSTLRRYVMEGKITPVAKTRILGPTPSHATRAGTRVTRMTLRAIS